MIEARAFRLGNIAEVGSLQLFKSRFNSETLAKRLSLLVFRYRFL